MGWIRRILWISGGLVLLITFITMMSQVYAEGLGWEGIDQAVYIWLYILGGGLLASMFLYDLLSFLSLRSDIHRTMDENEQITPEEISRMLDEPLWRVLPVFRKKYAPGILISNSGKYMYFNTSFQEKFIEEYSKGISVGDLAHQLNLSKREINLIMEELDYKEILPEVEIPTDVPQTEETPKGLRRTVHRRRKLKRK